MKNILDKFKNLFEKNEPSTKDLYSKMDALLMQAEEDVGGNFFPKEKTLSTEDVHYRAMHLKSGVGFDVIQQKYAKLKQKYNPDLYKSNEEKYKKAVELNARLEMAYSFFKNKFKIDE